MNLYEPLDINNILNNDSLDLISKQKRLEDIQIDSRITSKNIIQTKWYKENIIKNIGDVEIRIDQNIRMIKSKNRNSIAYIILSKMDMKYMILYLDSLLNLLLIDLLAGKESMKTISYNKITKKFVMYYLFNEYKEYNKNLSYDNKITYKEYMENILNINDKYEFINELMILFIGIFDTLLVYNLNILKVDYEYELNSMGKNIKSNSFYIFAPIHSEKILKEFSGIKNKFEYEIYTNNLPMICTPKDYVMEKVNKNYTITDGGYLYNGIKYKNTIFYSKPGLKYKSVVTKDNLIVTSINNMMKTGYRIDHEIYNFIMKYNNIGKFYINPEDIMNNSDIIEFINDRAKLRKKDEYKYIECESLLGSFRNESRILNIAKMFKDVKSFYFPLKIDFRGRIYTEPTDLTYQGTSLSKSLLEYSKEVKVYVDDIVNINYLYYYGCNAYGYSKISNNDKLKWVLENHSKILNFEENKMWLDAPDKLDFIKFCFEYKKLHNAKIKGLNYYYSHLIVNIDATCNGFQHIAMLLQDADLCNKLNLNNLTDKDKPHDWYLYVSEMVEYHISQSNDPKYNNLKNLKKIPRSVIKKPIMIMPYNAGSATFKKEILNNFTKKMINNEIKYVLIDHPNIILDYKDIYLLMDIIQYVINKTYPKINKLVNYLNTVAKISSKLKLSVKWDLPSGMIINQYYKNYITKEILINNRSTSIRFFNNTIDAIKSKTALMPNVIHSLDATSLVLLINRLYKIPNFSNFSSIHDCYATDLNHISLLKSHLTSAYINIYTHNNGFLTKFHEKWLQLIMITIESTTDISYIVKADRITHIKIPNSSNKSGYTILKIPHLDFIKFDNNFITYDNYNSI